ncbi:Asp-tRNA(Asn)/Glu-tRNA(Gln) amidotransferase subunit GatA [Parvularcula sp. ZS-1/3]|uniref:Glutamyl-tRNA(Gln) amidotransferase subunit A n=1 Tax=Parvularcula mediterranea TaxID=2732508 RepID=A0A7Y3RNV2_9PROT|nr:Asp-tRNA(Asn)/Glu-tRNA(Gln) amidotransferase subunit GatA [Parvularcula mediterranea]NNU16677.1 Asp-tRNA(Asn)/Glu-tRNA(Gln) amidotransferase subunit GatA [Parvularcula mediterranea]
MTDLTKKTIAELRDGYAAKDFSAAEVTDAYLSRAEAATDLNAYVRMTPDLAKSQAKASDERIAKGEARPLEGIPLGIKDLFCTKDIETNAASHILDGFVPPYESTVSQNLLDDGGVFLGKLNLDEFAMGSSNETSYYGPVVNPWRRGNEETKLTPGGSSGGSSSAVSARLCAAATATDTGGSIRQPASLTATVGIKPTYGRCSRWGIVAFASSLDQAGPITRDVRDGAIMLSSMASHDPKDSTSINRPVPDYEKALEGGVKGMKIGIPKEYRLDGMNEEIDAVWEKGAQLLRDQGAEVVEVSLPLTKYALPVYYIVAPAEASSNLARYDGVKYGLRVHDDNIHEMYMKTRAEGFGKEVQRRLMIGTYVLSAGYYDAYYLRAQRVRKKIADELAEVFKSVDLLLTPSSPGAAFGFGEKSADPIEMYLNDVFTVTANLAGIPGISVPAGLDAQGLPLGLQLLAPAFGEETMLRGARALEEALGFDAQPTEWWT